MAAEMIFRQLEFLKYVNGFRETGEGLEPTGQGIPIDIVLLPNLLLDIRAYIIRGEGSGRMCAVGGRAARTACALLHLIDDCDGTYNVHLMTKTGNLGRLLLENEFHRRGTGEPYRRLDLDFVVPREGEPRCAIWEAASERPKSQRPTESNELNVEDIQTGHRSLEAIRQARTVYLASLHTPNAEKLFEFLRKEMKEGRALFLETSRTEEEHLRRLIECMKRPGQDRLFLFITSVEKRLILDLASCSSVKQFCERYNITVIECTYPGDRKGKTEVICTRPGEVEIRRDCAFSFVREDVPEYFRAAVLLAYSLYQVIHDDAVPMSDELKAYLRNEWSSRQEDNAWRENGDVWEKIIDFAILMDRTEAEVKEKRETEGTNLVEGKGEPEDEEEHNVLLSKLVELSGGKRSVHVPLEPFKPEEPSISFMPSHNSREIRLDAPVLSHFARLAGYRRRPRGLEHRELPLCDPPSCIQRCPKRTGREAVAPAAVLIDLDGTLMDSTEQRNRGLEEALKALENVGFPQRQDCQAIEERICFFSQHVYDAWPIFKAFDLGDFRQQWNLPGWYATYIVLANPDNAQLATRITALANRLGSQRPLDEANRELKKPEAAEWMQEFRETYHKVLDRHQDIIIQAQAAFERVRMYPFKEAWDFLTSLKRTTAFELYVVSEGDPQTQWMKIQRTGLNEFFDQQRVLTTGAAAEPVEERRRLAHEVGDVERRWKEVSAELEQHGKTQEEMARVRSRIDRGMAVQEVRLSIPSSAAELTEIPRRVIHDVEKELIDRIVKLDFQREFLEQCREVAGLVDGVLSRMAEKGGVTFYAAAIRSILRSSKFPLVAIKDFGRLIHPSEHDATMKFAMIGDRHFNDIVPPLHLLSARRLLTIRLNSGKYALRESTERQRGNYPTYLAHTLAQVKAILLSSVVWRDITCTGDPPIFNLKVDRRQPNYRPENLEGADARVGLNLILHGVGMDPGRYPTIQMISFGILWEHLEHNGRREIESVLNPFLNPGQDDLPRDIRRRVLVLCAFVRADYAINSALMKGVKERFKPRLLEDKRLLEEPDLHDLAWRGRWDRDELALAIRHALERLQ